MKKTTTDSLRLLENKQNIKGRSQENNLALTGERFKSPIADKMANYRLGKRKTFNERLL